MYQLSLDDRIKMNMGVQRGSSLKKEYFSATPVQKAFLITLCVLGAIALVTPFVPSLLQKFHIQLPLKTLKAQEIILNHKRKFIGVGITLTIAAALWGTGMVRQYYIFKKQVNRALENGSDLSSLNVSEFTKKEKRSTIYRWGRNKNNLETSVRFNKKADGVYWIKFYRYPLKTR